MSTTEICGHIQTIVNRLLEQKGQPPVTLTGSSRFLGGGIPIDSLDLAVVSAGGFSGQAGSLVRELITDAEARELEQLGCAADIMCSFIDAEGRILAHPLNSRVMSVGVERLRQARHKVLASGGRARAPAIRAVIRSIGCNTLVTDEHAARTLLDQHA